MGLTYRELFLKFLCEFQPIDEFGTEPENTNAADDDGPNSLMSYYMHQAFKVLKSSGSTTEVDMQHLRAWELSQPEMTGIVHFILKNALFLMSEDHLHEVATVLTRKVLTLVPSEEFQLWNEYF